MTDEEKKPCWPVDYFQESKRRLNNLNKIKSNPECIPGIMSYYPKNPIEWINDWAVTYDPRNIDPTPKKIPFVLFEKQKEFISFLLELIEDGEKGLVEKSRDMGASWLCCAFSVHQWMFKNEVSIGFGSRKAQLVDRKGDPDSIFEKIRIILRSLPDWMMPEGFNFDVHSNYTRLINPYNGSTITGESGDMIGRGGRKSFYFNDEKAFYVNQEEVEAALSANTNVQIDLSTVNGMNQFHKNRFSGAFRVFIFDWRDHPGKDIEWYEKEKKDYKSRGLFHKFAGEVDRDYTGAVEGTFIPSEWVRAAIDAHLSIPVDSEGEDVIGFDVADGGIDKNAYISRKANIVTRIKSWRGLAEDAAHVVVPVPCDKVIYDNIGSGSAARTVFDLVKKNSIGWCAGDGVSNPEELYAKGKKNKDMFAGAKPQQWWFIRNLFLNTWKAVNGEDYDKDKVISIPSSVDGYQDLVEELSSPKMKWKPSGQILVESKDDMKKRGINSPNLADAFIMCYGDIKPKIRKVRVMFA